MSQGQRIALIFDTDVASFMPVLVIRKFDEISIEKKSCCAWDNISSIISLWEIFSSLKGNLLSSE